jgi:hypothetical protein
MQYDKKRIRRVSHAHAPNGSDPSKKFLQIENYIYDDSIKSSSVYLVTVSISDYGTKAFKV